MFTITKIAPNNFSHFDGFKEMNFSNWEINFNNTTNTIILQLRNGAPFPKKEVLASGVIIKDGISGTPETFSTTEQIRTRLLALNYNPLQSSVVGSAEWGGIGGDIENQTDLIEKLDEKEFTLVEGTNITIDRTNPLAPVISAEGGGAVDSVNGQTGVVVLDAEGVGAIPLSGTTVGNPITGNLEFYSSGTGVNPSINVSDGIKIDDGEGSSVAISSGTILLYSLNENGNITISFPNDLTSRGISGSDDYTQNITDFDYTQKIYVDTKAPLNPRVQSVTSSATVTPTSTNDIVTITAQAVALTLANPTGTFAEGQALMIRIKDNGTAQAITFGSNYRAIGVTLPTTTIANKILYLGIIYDSIDGKWNILGTPQQA